MADVLTFLLAVLGGFLGGYIGVTMAWWRIRDDVMRRLAGRTGL